MRTPFYDMPIDNELYEKARTEVIAKVTIPEYFKDNIDYEVDLSTKNSCLCPFHEEKTPSFRYNAADNYWRCFGKCQDGGKVIDLHKVKYDIGNHFEALWHMKEVYGKKYNLTFKNFFLSVDNKDMSIADLVKQKKPAMSMEDFLKPKAVSLTGVITKIEKQLLRLKAKDKTKYIEACITFDNLFVYGIKDTKPFQAFLQSLVKM